MGNENPASPVSSTMTKLMTPARRLPIHAYECPVSIRTQEAVRFMRTERSALLSSLRVTVSEYDGLRHMVEAKTAELNAHIVALNNLKANLGDMHKQVQSKKYRVRELEHKEHLAKLSDVMTCLEKNKKEIETDQASRNKLLTDLKKQKEDLTSQLKQIASSVEQLSTASATGQPDQQQGEGGEGSESKDN
eukprot:jgi/Bigna1/130314/aug1.11_g5022